MNRFSTTLISLLFCLICQSQPVEKMHIGDLEKWIENSREPVVVNFWATYCLPCLREIPVLESLAAEFGSRKIQLLLVSLDLRDDYPRIDSFCRRRGISARVVWLDETNADLFCPRIDRSWSGSIPATLFVNRKMGYRRFFERSLTEEELKKEFMAIPGSR